MSTVSLQMIVKDEFELVDDLLDDAELYFDEINLTVSDKTTANKLRKNHPNANVKYREWTDNFADARNANYALSTTDYTFWIDSDDQFDFTRIKELVETADEEGAEAIFLPYNYAFDERGNVITRHWRERLVRNNCGYEWRGAVHETYVNEDPGLTLRIDQPVNHLSSGHKASLDRNHSILEAEYLRDGDDTDPRTLMYLGMSHFSRGNYSKCIEVLSDYLEVSGSVEDTYRSLEIISEAAYHSGHHEHALEYAMRCIALKPEYPQGYWLMAQYEADQENWEPALEWVKTSLTKPDPETLAVFDPTARQRAILIGAQAEFMLENYNAALAYLRKIPKNETAKGLLDDFTAEADKETFLALLPRVSKYFTNKLNLWDNLTEDLKYDKRIRGLRNEVTFPRKWDDKSIVIFCGQGYEEWGPHTLDKGMGGSEEAIVYLAPELANLGYHVTVYGEVPKHMMQNEGRTDGVRWVPWQEIDLRDEFNVFVAWRSPKILERVNAKVKLADIHDVLPEELIENYPDVTYLFKSDYHKDLYGPVKSAVIGNGIKKDQFNGTSGN